MSRLLGDDIYFFAANGPTLLDLWAHAFVAEVVAPPIDSPLKEASLAHTNLTDHFQRLQARPLHVIQLTRTARSHCRWWQTIDPETADSDQATRARAIRRGLIGFILSVLLGMLEPFSLQGQELQPPPSAGLQTATFAGGCFWCMVHPLEVIDGVISTISGYTGGSVVSPTYEQVSAGGTGQKESVEVVFDPKKVSYQTLLDVYWRNINPFDDKDQFCDKGNQYRSAIFVTNDEQKALAEASKRKLEERFGRPIATDILAAGPFYGAEEYYQDYYKKNPLHYRFYRFSCGRDARLRQVWGEAGGSEK